MRSLTVVSAGRRFVFLTTLRWLPLGIQVPVTVLLASSRGLRPGDIGLIFVAHSLVALLLELPTGGLADAIGRRPVLVLSGLLYVAGAFAMVVAQDLLQFVAAFAVFGAARALDSGPLESWYVDAVHEIDPAADVTGGLSRAGVANGAGLAVGAAIGGLAPALAASLDAGRDALIIPFLVAALFNVLSVIAVLALLVPVGPSSDLSASAAIRTGVKEVPTIIRNTLRLTARDHVLRKLLIITFLIGTVLSTLELVGPLRFAELTGSRTDGTAVFGIVMAVSFGAAGLGAAFATLARRAASGSAGLANAVVFGVCALAVVGVGMSAAVLVAAAAYVFFYLINGVGWPSRQQLMHSRVDAGRRSTTVSASSFALMIGGVAGSLLAPRLAEATSLSVALLAGAVPLLLAGALALRLRSATAHPPGNAGTASTGGAEGRPATVTADHDDARASSSRPSRISR